MKGGGVDWRRVKRWCALGAIAMTIWLLVPAARCSWRAFRAIPVGQVDDNAPSTADKDRVVQGTGFWTKLSNATSACYEQTPLMDQGALTNVWLALIAVTIFAWAMDYVDRTRHRPYT